MVDRARWLTWALLALCASACTATPVAQDGGADAQGNYEFFIGTLTADQIRRVCVIDESCHVDFVSENTGVAEEDGIGQCITALTAVLPGHESEGIPATAIRCALSATSCSAYQLCAGGGYNASYCFGVSNHGSCDGQIAVSCLAAPPGEPSTPSRFATDCAAQGLSCNVEQFGTDAYASCTAGSCVPPDGGTAPQHCVGSVEQQCGSNGQLEARDCSLVAPGELCEEGRGCVDGTLPTCVGAGYQCQGTHVVQCNHGRQYDHDCATVVSGGTCMLSTDGSAAYCVSSPSAECDSFADGVDQCVGNSIRLCASGHYVTVDCTSLGFSTCSTASGGTALCVE